MKVFSLGLVILLAGCASDANVLCERAAECIANGGFDVDECVDAVDDAVGIDDDLAKCAECAEERTCAEIRSGACVADCANVSAQVLILEW
ncbi:MAG: hypothetical protein KC416_13780 [Myxococcales bacterium]|nr:hypothetical protein [Myxococcales bacterium]